MYDHCEFDELDAELLWERYGLFQHDPKPRCGDFVRFACGTLRRISHIWPDGVQTSAGGDWYLGHGYVSFSGALYTSVPLSTLVRTDETREGRFWFFHHDRPGAGRGVGFCKDCRVYTCSVPAPQL
jgi:hypothetical protein